MTQDRRTKEQLLNALAEQKALTGEVQAELSKVKRALEDIPKPPTPERVPVADALAGCVRALDRIAPKNHYGSTGNTDVKHVISMLCDRYSVLRVERVTEACQLTHVENLTANDLVEMLKRTPGLNF